jgi:hypothetical protein
MPDAPVKYAFRKLVRNPQTNMVEIVFVDMQTGQILTSLAGYTIWNAGNAGGPALPPGGGGNGGGNDDDDDSDHHGGGGGGGNKGGTSGRGGPGGYHTNSDWDNNGGSGGGLFDWFKEATGGWTFGLAPGDVGQKGWITNPLTNQPTVITAQPPADVGAAIGAGVGKAVDMIDWLSGNNTPDISPAAAPIDLANPPAGGSPNLNPTKEPSRVPPLSGGMNPTSTSFTPTKMDQANVPLTGGTIPDAPSGPADALAPLRNLIGKAEGTGDNYNETYAYGKWTGGDVDLSNMTIGQVKQLQARMLENQKRAGVPADQRSTAVGRYQIMSFNLPEIQTAMGLSDNEKFTPQIQDAMADHLILNKRGGQTWLNGRMSDARFIEGLANEWAAIPLGNGVSAHDGVGNNAARVSVQEVLQTFQQVKTIAANPAAGGMSVPSYMLDPNMMNAPTPMPSTGVIGNPYAVAPATLQKPHGPSIVPTGLPPTSYDIVPATGNLNGVNTPSPEPNFPPGLAPGEVPPVPGASVTPTPSAATQSSMITPGQDEKSFMGQNPKMNQVIAGQEPNLTRSIAGGVPNLTPTPQPAPAQVDPTTRSRVGVDDFADVAGVDAFRTPNERAFMTVAKNRGALAGLSPSESFMLGRNPETGIASPTEWDSLADSYFQTTGKDLSQSVNNEGEKGIIGGLQHVQDILNNNIPLDGKSPSANITTLWEEYTTELKTIPDYGFGSPDAGGFMPTTPSAGVKPYTPGAVTPAGSYPATPQFLNNMFSPEQAYNAMKDSYGTPPASVLPDGTKVSPPGFTYFPDDQFNDPAYRDAPGGFMPEMRVPDSNVGSQVGITKASSTAPRLSVKERDALADTSGIAGDAKPKVTTKTPTKVTTKSSSKDDDDDDKDEKKKKQAQQDAQKKQDAAKKASSTPSKTTTKTPTKSSTPAKAPAKTTTKTSSQTAAQKKAADQKAAQSAADKAKAADAAKKKAAADKAKRAALDAKQDG